MKTDGVLFDLDGTLWDATESITMVWNEVLKDLYPKAKKPVTQQEIRRCMGLLLPDIGKRLFPELPENRQAELVDAFCMRETQLLEKTGGHLYPALRETLTVLRERFPLFIVSNCQSGYIECFLKAHDMGSFFTDIECAGRTGLPKCENIKLVAKRNKLSAPVYVGDTELDGQSAKQAGVAFVHAAYGFGIVKNADCKVNCFAELSEVLSGF